MDKQQSVRFWVNVEVSYCLRCRKEHPRQRLVCPACGSRLVRKAIRQPVVER